MLKSKVMFKSKFWIGFAFRIFLIEINFREASGDEDIEEIEDGDEDDDI